MRQTRKRAAKRGFTLIELLVVVAIIALLISILLPSLARARELSRRTVCAANQKGIGIGFYAYATGNADRFPIANHAKSSTVGMTATTTTPVSGSVNYYLAYGSPRMIDGTLTGETDPVNGAADYKLSTTRNLWLLIRNSASSPKSFICPSATTDSPNGADNPQLRWDFGTADTYTAGDASVKDGWKQCSYGYQVPYGQAGQPGTYLDNDMVQLADKGPFSAALEGSLGTMKEVTDASDGPVPNLNSAPDDWKRFNSPNHGEYRNGEGQTVMFTDGRADFVTTPLAGVAKDNIYTRWDTEKASPDYGTGATPDGRYQGVALITGAPGVDGTAACYAPYGDKDTLIWP